MHPQRSLAGTEQQDSESFVQSTQSRGQETGAALVLGLHRLRPPRSPSHLVPTRARLGREFSGEQSPHFPLCTSEATAGQTMALLGIKGAGPLLETKAESQLDKNDNGSALLSEPAPWSPTGPWPPHTAAPPLGPAPSRPSAFRAAGSAHRPCLCPPLALGTPTLHQHFCPTMLLGRLRPGQMAPYCSHQQQTWAPVCPPSPGHTDL